MSNGEPKNVYERLWKLWAMVCKLVLDKKRDPEYIADVLQQLVKQGGSWPGLLYCDKPTVLQAGDTLLFDKEGSYLFIERQTRRGPVPLCFQYNHTEAPQWPIAVGTLKKEDAVWHARLIAGLVGFNTSFSETESHWKFMLQVFEPFSDNPPVHVSEENTGL